MGGVPIKAKIDTGARTSALHAARLEVVDVDGVPTARFQYRPVQHKARPSFDVELPIEGWRDVRSSNGKVQKRPVVTTRIKLGEVTWKVRLTLTRRDEMGFRMLLGRQAVKRRFLVDVSHSFLTGKPPAGAARTAPPGAERVRSDSDAPVGPERGAGSTAPRRRA